jgi:3-deoxy-7-phosphoheptulonate synthase
MTPPYKLASRQTRPTDTVIRVGDAVFGGESVALIAGPCAVESRKQTLEIARHMRAMGVKMLRGGAFKPRTSPYSFQGLEEEGLRILADVREQTGMAVVTEVMDTTEVELVASYTDVLQVGTRNMQNFRLLQHLGRQPKPVLLKRGMSATIEEFLMAAEYIMAEGNPNVILCERGIRSFEPMTRATFDLTAVPLLKQLTHLPVIVDPSHATGHAVLVTPVALGATAAGADGLIVEAHTDPASAALDGNQTLDMPQLASLIDQIDAVAGAVGRRLDLALHATRADTAGTATRDARARAREAVA